MSARESQTQLSVRLARAAEQVTVGARYMHYKQQAYKVIALALREADSEPAVVYKAEYGDHIAFVRPVTSWLEMVEVDGQSVARFTRIKD